MTILLLLSLLVFTAGAALVYAALTLLERYEEHVIEPCRHCTPGVHWHFGEFCPSSPRGNRGPLGQAPGTAAAQADQLASSSWSAEFSGGGAVGPRPPAGPSQVHPAWNPREKRPLRRTP